MALTMAFLNAARSTEETSENFHRAVPCTLEEFVVSERDIPDGYDFDGAIISGSAASVYQGDQWIEALCAWVRDAQGADFPLLGICFGAQVLASALGGSVEGQSARELGYRTVRHSGDSPLFAGIDGRFTVFVSHGDDIVELPLGARVIARNDEALHGFRMDDAFGVLSHPEFSVATAERVVEGYDDEPIRRGNPAETITEENVTAAAEADAIFDNFVAYARLQR